MKVIAKKIRALPNATLGYIEPIFKFDDISQTYIPVLKEMFPNEGEIFIYGGYSNIDNFYQDEELFEIENISLNQTNYNPDNPQSCQYVASASNIEKIKQTTFIKIFDANFQYPNKAVKDLGYSRIDFPFFIESNSELFGPFQYDGTELRTVEISYFDDEEYNDDETIQDILLENKECIYKINRANATTLLSNNYIVDLSALLRNPSTEVLYFGTKESVIDWGKSILKSKLSEQEVQTLTKLKSLSLPNFNSNSDKQKLDLFFSYLNATDLWFNAELPKYLNIFFTNQESTGYIEKYLDDNKVSLFAQYRKDELLEIDANLTNKRDELSAIEQQINDYKKQLDTQEDKIFENIEDLEKEELKSIIKNLDTRKKLLQYHKENKSLDDINKDIQIKEGQRIYLQKDISDLESRQTTITDAIQSVKNEFFKDSDFAKKILEAKLYTDLLNNIDPRGDDLDSNALDHQDSLLAINNASFDSLKQFVQEIQYRLQKNGRTISYNDVANYLISVYQNFLTIFVGLPGVGKTSLVEKLAKSLGCLDNERYLKIPVSRGWTSSRDLLGYFNPLTKKYQSSKTGLLNSLEVSARDYKAGQIFPNIILLDEANLSPIEHYWSDFLAITDDDYFKSINKTDTEKVDFGSGVRFLATINYDHTTEFISNRLISRAPIIKLSGNSYSHEDFKSVQSEMDIFTMTTIEGLFQQKTNKEYFKGDVKNKFDNIIKTLEDEDSSFGVPIILGHRKFNSIENYCNIAGNVMEDENNFTALDYAINQFVLPMIAGRGENFGKRLNNLAEKFQGLPQSSSHLRKIIKSGDENFKNYNFFC